MGEVESPSPPDNRGRSRRRVAFVVAAAFVLLVPAMVAVLVSRNDGTSYPDEWDPRIQELADFVEEERGLEFEHPVQVDFVSEDEWRDRAQDAADDLSDEDRQLLEHGAGLFRAFGLAEGEFDLLESSLNLTTSGTVGRYEFDNERISVRGSELGPGARATLVHELTHALQDQHFDIGDRLEGAQDDESPSQLTALSEGDAERIEAAWTDSLSDEESHAQERAQAKTSEATEDALSEIPASLVAFFTADYVLGPRFVAVVLADGGRNALDDAFTDPPGPAEHLLDPLSYLAHDEPAEVERPPLGGGATAIDDFRGEFGALGLFLVLAERIDPLRALAAVDGWDGDAYLVFESAGRTCARVAVQADDDRAVTELEAALEDWRDAMPSEAGATVSKDDNTVMLETCDPGSDAEVIDGDGRSSQAMAVPALRADIAVEVLDNEGTVEQARCFSHGFLTLFTFEELLLDETPPERQEELQHAAIDLREQCINAS